MDWHQRTKRFGMAVILCAAVLRLTVSGFPQWLAETVIQPNTAAFLIYLETGRDVRFSASEGEVSDFFRESPPPGTQAPERPSFDRVEAAQLAVTYSCALRPDLETLVRRELCWDLVEQIPTVLILHTHTTESYTKAGESYIESADYRTLDEAYNMLSIGDRVARLLEQAGIGVVHDRQLHDYPSYNGSYNHARKAILANLEAHPGLRLVLDLHRDAAGTTEKQLRTQAEVDGQTAAQLMLVVGTNASGQAHAGWEENLALALKLQALLEERHPGLMRPLNLRAQRFNQDLSAGALLVEVGAAGNTHREALLAAEALAEGIIALAKGADGE